MTVYISGARMLTLAAVHRAARALAEDLGEQLGNTDPHWLAARMLIAAHVYPVPVPGATSEYQTLDPDSTQHYRTGGAHRAPDAISGAPQAAPCPFPTSRIAG